MNMSLTRRGFLQGASAMLAVVGIGRKGLPGPVPEEATQVWTTADGEAIRICDLTDDHLRNIIFYINKQFAAFAYIDDTAWVHNTPSDSWPIYDTLRREANRRKLTWI